MSSCGQHLPRERASPRSFLSIFRFAVVVRDPDQLAAVSVTTSIVLLLSMKSMFGIKGSLFQPKMLGSIVVFCQNPSPPSPKSFLSCLAFVAGAALRVFQGFGRHIDAMAAGNLSRPPWVSSAQLPQCHGMVPCGNRFTSRALADMPHLAGFSACLVAKFVFALPIGR